METITLIISLLNLIISLVCTHYTLQQIKMQSIKNQNPDFNIKDKK